MIVNRKKLAFFLLLILSLGLSSCGFFRTKKLSRKNQNPQLYLEEK